MEEFAKSIAVSSAGGSDLQARSRTLRPRPSRSARSPAGVDAFITALSRDGRRLLWSTYLGGPHDPNCANCGDFGYDIAVTSTGAVAVAGFTASFEFPVTPDGYQTECAGPPVYCGDAFVSLLS